MLTLLLLLAIYFLPTIITAHRGFHALGFGLLNLFFGWTGFGWLALLLWALLREPAYFVPVPYAPGVVYPDAYPRRW